MELNFKKNVPLIVLDLDCTFWPFKVDKLSKLFMLDDTSGKVVDTNRTVCECFPHALKSLRFLIDSGYPVAIASRIANIAGAYQLLHLFDISRFFDYKAIYPGCKVKHFKHLHAVSGVQMKDMMFFDDDRRNVRDVSRLGVTCVLVTDGITIEIIKDSLRKFYESKIS